MRTSSIRRFRRRAAGSRETGVFKKDNREQSFFGPSAAEPFFQPVNSVQRKEDMNKEEEKVQRATEKKEEEKVQRAAREEEETAQRAEDKKEEEGVQRKGEEEEKNLQRAEDKKEGEPVQKKDNNNGVTKTGAKAANYIQSINSKGQQMPEDAKGFYSERMGYDFDDVKVHTGKEAADSAKDINAKAYTYGNNIVFNDGQYNTNSHEGKKLLAHELTHVVQQGAIHNSSKANRKINNKTGLQVQRGFWGDVWDGVKSVAGSVASTVWGGVKSVAGWGWDVLKSAGAWVWDFVTWMPKRMWSMLKHIGSGIIGTITWLWNGLTGALGHIWDGIKGVFSWAVDGVSGLFSWIWRGLQGGAKWAWKLLNGDFSGFWDGFADAFSWLGAGISGLFAWGWKGLEGLVMWGWKGLKGLGKWLWDGILGGLAWIGRYLAKLLDIMGLGEAWTFLMNIIKFWSTRTMTGVEIAEARKVFGGSLSYWQVRIDEMSLIAKIGAWFQGSSGMGVTTGHTINFNKKISAAPGNNDMAWLIHELGHVGQYTYVGLQYIGEAIHAQATGGYDYGGGAALAGKDLKDFNREQQADIMRDYYKHVVYGSSLYAADYTRLRNQAIAGKY